MAIRATITVVRASAETKHVSLFAKTTNVNAEAIAFVNPDSKNQWFYETATLSDVRFTLIEKGVSETVTLDESVEWSYAKSAPETLTLVEDFVKAVSYNRTITDFFTLDDASQVDKDYFGNKGNVAFILDIIGLDHSKIESDGYTVSDVVVVAMSFLREFTDGATLGDSDYFDFGKNKEETLTIGELSAKQLGKTETEILTATDDSVIQAELNKPETLNLTETYSNALAKFITDAFTLDDLAQINKDLYNDKGNIVGFTEVLAQGIGKNLTDPTTLSDEHGTSLNKPFTETLSFNDITVTNIIKTVTDAFTLDDSTLVDKNFYGNKGNIVGLTEIVQQGISKIESDIVTISELAEIGYTKPKTDDISVGDVSSLHPELIKSEIIGFTDSYVRSISKVLTDAFTLDDTTQVNKDVDSNKGNIFGFSDVFDRVVSYTREYTDSFGFSEDFAMAVSYVRAYTDSFGFSDTRDVSLTKVFTDSITVFDNEINPLNTSLLNAKVLNVRDTSLLFTKEKSPSELFGLSEITVFGYNKGITDSATTSDINSVSVLKTETDSYTVTDESTLSSDISKTDSFSFGDSYTRAIGKVITDAFTLDDSALVDKNYFGNKGNIVAFTDVVVKAIDFKRSFTDSCVFSESRATSLGLVKSDETTLSDNNSKQYSKVSSSDTFGFTDISAIGATKVVSDSANLSELIGKDPSKSVTNSFGVSDVFNKVTAYKLRPTDAFNLDDSTLVDKNFYGNKGNIFGFSDVLSKTIAFNRGFTETLGFSEVKNKSLSKEFSDFSTMGDSINVSPTKQFSESLTFNDAFGLQLEKTLSDGFGLDDSALIDKDYFGNKGNIVGVTDVVVINLVQSNVLGSRPLNTMSLN